MYSFSTQDMLFPLLMETRTEATVSILNLESTLKVLRDNRPMVGLHLPDAVSCQKQSLMHLTTAYCPLL